MDILCQLVGTANPWSGISDVIENGTISSTKKSFVKKQSFSIYLETITRSIVTLGAGMIDSVAAFAEWKGNE